MQLTQLPDSCSTNNTIIAVAQRSNVTRDKMMGVLLRQQRTTHVRCVSLCVSVCVRAYVHLVQIDIYLLPNNMDAQTNSNTHFVCRSEGAHVFLWNAQTRTSNNRQRTTSHRHHHYCILPYHTHTLYDYIVGSLHAQFGRWSTTLHVILSCRMTIWRCHRAVCALV